MGLLDGGRGCFAWCQLSPCFAACGGHAKSGFATPSITRWSLAPGGSGGIAWAVRAAPALLGAAPVMLEAAGAVPAAVALSLLGVAVLAWLRPVLGLGDLAGELADYGVPRAMLPVLTLYQSSVHVAFEEWFWRRLLAPRLGGVNDVLFGAYHVFIFLLFAHWPWVALACAALAVAGCVWRWVAGRDGLRWAIAAHATGSFGCMVVLGLW